MPCDTVRIPGLTSEQRKKQIEEALERLRSSLASGEVTVDIGPQGSVAFSGWSEASRDRVTDLCAYHKLSEQGSWELSQAISSAEMMSGRKVNGDAVAAGWHTHDGKTWGRH